MPKKVETAYNAEMLRSVVDRLERLSGRLQAVIAWMEQEGRSELAITNSSSMLQGLDYAEAFGQAAERAVDNRRLGELKVVKHDDE